MIAVIQSEYLKYKRTFTRKLILCAPLFILILALLVKIVAPDQNGDWSFLLTVIYNWWPVIFIPIGMALFAALIHIQEKKAGNLVNLRIHNVSPCRVWFAKIAVMAIHSFWATLVLIVCTLASVLLIAADSSVPWNQLIIGGLLIWLVSLPLIPLQLMAAFWKGLFSSMGLGIIGFFWGVSVAPGANWMFVPWSWPSRLMAPIVGVHPNGVSLPPGDPLLLDTSVIPLGIGISIAALILFSSLSALWFSRKELR